MSGPPVRRTTLRPIVGAAITIVALGLNLRSQTLLGPTPYLSFVDSPFNALQTSGGFTYFYLETFEDGLLNTPGVSANTGSVLGPGGLTDSVDADDGVIDGSGLTGHTWVFGSSPVIFTFSAATLGALPTHAGLVWTDGPHPTYEAFDALGNSLGGRSSERARTAPSRARPARTAFLG